MPLSEELWIKREYQCIDRVRFVDRLRYSLSAGVGAKTKQVF